MNSIVITGMGMITPLGSGTETCWTKIKQGQSLVNAPLDSELPESFRTFCRPAVRAQNPLGFSAHPIFSLALSAVEEALQNANLNLSTMESERIGCAVSVSKPILTQSGLWCLAPGASHPVPGTGCSLTRNFQSPDVVNQFLRHTLNIIGPTSNVVAACATGIYSILVASRWLEKGECDVAIAGSVESSLHPLYLSGFSKMDLLSDCPSPFDKNRNGFMIAEGAGILILEKKEHALARRAKPIAELAGCAIGTDPSHATTFISDGSSIARVIQKALQNSETMIQDVDYINTHGTGTLLNDCVETRAIKKTFEHYADQVSLSSTKASTGHLLGASGSVEMGLTALALRDGFIPPTLNLRTPDPECDLDYTPLQGKNRSVHTALSISFGFGGSIGAIVLRSI